MKAGILTALLGDVKTGVNKKALSKAQVTVRTDGKNVDTLVEEYAEKARQAQENAEQKQEDEARNSEKSDGLA